MACDGQTNLTFGLPRKKTTTTQLRSNEKKTRTTDSNLTNAGKILLAQAGDSAELPCQAFPWTAGEQLASLSANKRRRVANLRPLGQRSLDSSSWSTSLEDSLQSGGGGEAESLQVEEDEQELEQERAELLERQTRRGDNLGDHLISLVFWYKDDNPVPIYTLDARQASLLPAAAAAAESLVAPTTPPPPSAFASPQANGSTAAASRLESQIVALNRRLLGQAKHYAAASSADAPTVRLDWTEDEAWAGGESRSKSREQQQQPLVIRLRLSKLRANQSGDYKCRVDFRRARTIRQTTRLFVQGKCARLQPLDGLQKFEMRPKHRGVGLEHAQAWRLICNLLCLVPRPLAAASPQIQCP